MRYPKRYLGNEQEKKQQIAEDLSDISTDEEFSKLEKNVREKKYDEWVGEESVSDEEFVLPSKSTSKYPSLIYPSGSETGGTESFPFPFLSSPFPALKLSLNNLS